MKYPRVKLGLLLIGIYICVSVFVALLIIINAFAQQSGLSTVAGVFTILGILVELVGLVICGTSKSKNFLAALISVGAGFVLAIVMMCLTDPKAIQIFAILTAIADVVATIFVIRGCAEVSSSNRVKTLSKTTLILLGAYFVMSVVIAVLALMNVQFPPVLSVILQLLSLAYLVCYAILIWAAWKTVE